VLRNPDTFGEIAIGRQRYLKGPIQNVITGTLITQEIRDGIMWTPRLGGDPRFGLDLSLLHDSYPFEIPGNQGGYHVRATFEDTIGAFGLNVLKANGVGVTPTGKVTTGVTVDASVPAIPSTLDLYGEFGSNIFGQNIRTFGAYFPVAHDAWGIDAFLETTSRVGTAPGITVLRVYYPVLPSLTLLFTADKVSGLGGVNFGFGLVARLFQ